MSRKIVIHVHDANQSENEKARAQASASAIREWRQKLMTISSQLSHAGTQSYHEPEAKAVIREAEILVDQARKVLYKVQG